MCIGRMDSLANLDRDVSACLVFLLTNQHEWQLEASMQRYEVVEYSGCQWVRRVGESDPTLYFEGTSEDVVDVANKAAGLLAIKLVQEERGRYQRAQDQMELVLGLPGVHVWKRES